MEQLSWKKLHDWLAECRADFPLVPGGQDAFDLTHDARWRQWIFFHDDAQQLVGAGAYRFEFRHINVMDSNTLTYRTDFVVRRCDNTAVRLHPFIRKVRGRSEAVPVYGDVSHWALTDGVLASTVDTRGLFPPDASRLDRRSDEPYTNVSRADTIGRREAKAFLATVEGDLRGGGPDAAVDITNSRAFPWWRYVSGKSWAQPLTEASVEAVHVVWNAAEGAAAFRFRTAAKTYVVTPSAPQKKREFVDFSPST